MTPKPAAHTPTPWRVEGDVEIIAVKNEKEMRVADIEGSLGSDSVDMANAAFIVRAANLLGDIEKMSKEKCICQDSGCLACISSRVLKVFEAEGQ